MLCYVAYVTQVHLEGWSFNRSVCVKDNIKHPCNGCWCWCDVLEIFGLLLNIAK